MSRVKRGVIAHARHKKILNMAKGYRGRNKNVSELPLKKSRKHCSMLTATEEPKRETSVLCGFSASTPQPVCMT